jgi:site-specific DNA-methyltransferase (adenine-specific)
LRSASDLGTESLMRQAQPTFSGDQEAHELSIGEAAQQAGVSPATIRNWIKTGYLNQKRKGFVGTDAFNQFIKNVAGCEKLNSRANKSFKDSHDHADLSASILKRLSSEHVCLESLGEEYQRALSDAYKNKEGVYYTPGSIVADLFREPDCDVSSKRFCDPCCGSGNFIMRALDLGFKPENLYGYDTDPVAIAITKQRIFERTSYRSRNIVQKDFLHVAAASTDMFFDYVYTNPPWGKTLAKNEKALYGSLFYASKSLDTSALFFFACLKCLKKYGQLGLLLPEAFFNISTFEYARARALKLTIERLIDYGKPFKGLVTKAQAIVLANNERDSNSHQLACESGGKKFTRAVNTFYDNPRLIFNFHCDRHDAEVIKHIFSIPHATLKRWATWGLGIVTGNNKKFCKSKPSDGYMPVYKGSDIQGATLKPASCFIPADLSLYQQVAPVERFQSPEKLIYRFISSNLRFFYDAEQRFVLNSANFLVLSEDFPISARQLCDMLNSSLMNWIFTSIFNTHKVLRGDLEALPIHTDYFTCNPYFDEASFLDYLNIQVDKHGAYRVKKNVFNSAK